MAKKDKVPVRLTNQEDDGSTMISMEEEGGFFGRMFSPGTVATDVSGNTGEEDSEFDGSIDSGTIYTDMSDASQSESDDSSDESSTGSTVIRFDRDLRAKHRGACKNMTVGVICWIYFR